MVQRLHRLDVHSENVLPHIILQRLQLVRRVRTCRNREDYRLNGKRDGQEALIDVADLDQVLLVTMIWSRERTEG